MLSCCLAAYADSATHAGFSPPEHVERVGEGERTGWDGAGSPQERGGERSSIRRLLPMHHSPRPAPQRRADGPVGTRGWEQTRAKGSRGLEGNGQRGPSSMAPGGGRGGPQPGWDEASGWRARQGWGSPGLVPRYQREGALETWRQKAPAGLLCSLALAPGSAPISKWHQQLWGQVGK